MIYKCKSFRDGMNIQGSEPNIQVRVFGMLVLQYYIVLRVQSIAKRLFNFYRFHEC